MKTTIYIIPGFGETCSEVRYKKLAATLESKGYIVNRVKPNWYIPLSLNVFVPKKNSILIGFSFGAVIAYLVANKYPVTKIIFCSLSPINTMTWHDLRKDYEKHMDKLTAERNADDIKDIIISLKKLKYPYITLAGEYEDLPANILIPKAGHFLTRAYINCIKNLI